MTFKAENSPVGRLLLMSMRQVTDTLGVSRSTLYEWRNSGSFPQGHRIGPNRIAWKVADVEAFLEARRAA